MSWRDEPGLITRDVASGSMGAFVVLVWENLTTLDDEVELIWSKPSTSWIKWAFLFARYFPLVTQLCNRAIDLEILRGHSLNIHSIRTWYTCQVLVAYLATTGAELVMMARVYALYNRHWAVRLGFVALIIGETIAVILGMIFNRPGSEFQIRDFILFTSGPFIYLGVSSLLIQVTILTLSVARYMWEEWGGAPIVLLMMRDGTLAFCTVTLISALIVVYTIIGFPFSGAAYAWMITFIAVTECRIIINMQRLPGPKPRSDDQTTSLQLTTLYNTRRTTRRPDIRDEVDEEVSVRPSARTSETIHVQV